MNSILASFKLSPHFAPALEIRRTAGKYHLVTHKIEALPELYKILVPQHMSVEEFARNREIIFQIRGVVVCDTDSGMVTVTRAFPYTSTAVVESGNSFTPDDAGFVNLMDTDGVAHSIPIGAETTSFTPYINGCVIRVSLHNSEIKVSTSSSLNIQNSRWGNSPKFLELYKTLGGPDFDDLFGVVDEDGPKDSNWTFVFMIVSPHLQTGMNGVVGSGYIVYLGAFPNADVASTPPTWTDLPKYRDRFTSVSARGKHGLVVPYAPPTDYSKEETPRILIIPTSISVATGFGLDEIQSLVGTILSFGSSDLREYPKDPRLSGGECVVCTYITKEGFTRMVRISSVAYMWREAMQGSNPNRFNRFCTLTSYALGANSGLTPNVAGKTWAELFNGNVSNVYTEEQLFPRIGHPSFQEVSILIGTEDKPTFANASSNEDPIIVASTGVTTPITLEIITATIRSLAERQRLLKGRDARDITISNIFLSYVLSVPLVHIPDVIRFYVNFVNLRETTVSYLTTNFAAFKAIPTPGQKPTPGFCDNEIAGGGQRLSDFPEFSTESPSRDGSAKTRKLNTAGMVVMRIFTGAVVDFEKKFTAARGSNASLTRLMMAQNNLRNFINKERGPSLYSLMMSVRRIVAKASGVPDMTDLMDNI